MYLRELIDKLSIYNRIVFAGLGNELREDDGAGIYLLRKIKASDYFRGAYFIEAGTTPENYLSLIIDYKPDVLVFIDSVHSDGYPGQVKFLSMDEISELGFSTHSFSIKMIEDYIRNFSDLEILYLGIVPYKTGVSRGLSAAVKTSLDNFIGQEV